MTALRTEMTHGDKEKAKAAKSNKASVKKAGENGKGKAVEAAKSASKTVPENKGGGKTGKAAEKSSGKTAGAKAAAAKKASSAAKDAASYPDPQADANNPVVAAAERAIKKYPNAFRKLTD
jgi:hypothetical protein